MDKPKGNEPSRPARLSWADRKRGQKRGMRRGSVFPVRLTAEQRARLEQLQAETAGPDALGPFLVWAAERAALARVLPARDRAGNTGPRYYPARPGNTPPASSSGITRSMIGAAGAGNTSAAKGRLILDLCAGSGAWSEPYKQAGYRVECVTLPGADVRSYEPPADVWGVLAAPPCDQFSLARNGHDSPRDFAGALEVVTACLRIVAMARPQWWALENPVGLLGRWLGTPRDVWEPYEFGDAWTKRTAIWGDFVLPARGPFVDPCGSAMDRPTAAERAVTPAGFARAFFAANP